MADLTDGQIVRSRTDRGTVGGRANRDRSERLPKRLRVRFSTGCARSRGGFRLSRRALPGIRGEVSAVHVVVVGCGRVGSGLARTLEESGHTVAVVDRRSKAFERLPEGFSGKTVLGVGFDRDRLKAAGIEEASALAAVTNGDNSNILVARVARETFGIENVVARIYDPRRAKIYERLGVPTIATVEWATERVLQRILPERPTAEWIDGSAKVCLIERPVPARWAGKKVSDLDLAGLARVAVVTRLGEGTVASVDTVLQEGDLVHVSVDGGSIEFFDKHLSGALQGGTH